MEASGLPSRGPKNSRGCYVTLAFSRAQKSATNATSPLQSGRSTTPSTGSKKSQVVPNKGVQNKKWLPHNCLLGGPNKAGNATSPLRPRGSPTPSTGSKKPERVPNKGEQNQHWLPHGCLLGGQIRLEMLSHPYILGIPNTGEQHQSWLPHSFILGDPQRQAREATNHKGSPTKGIKIRSGCLTPASS